MKLCTGVGVDGNGCLGLLRDTDPDECSGCRITVSLVRSVESTFDRMARESTDFADQVRADAADDRNPLD